MRATQVCVGAHAPHAAHEGLRPQPAAWTRSWGRHGLDFGLGQPPPPALMPAQARPHAHTHGRMRACNTGVGGCKCSPCCARGFEATACSMMDRQLGRPSTPTVRALVAVEVALVREGRADECDLRARPDVRNDALQRL